MLTMISRKTVAISRRMMNAITVRGAGARPAQARRAPALSPTLSCVLDYRTGSLRSQSAVVVHAVVRLHHDVGEVRAAVQQRLGVDRGQHDRLLHHLRVDLVGEGVLLRR